ncbi:hypothetical protein EDD21DRAFT_386614 [Dissophora ornata]|nr:hypothetical protein EDD21DRAFT_386614 [Dissophora ornata]
MCVMLLLLFLLAQLSQKVIAKFLRPRPIRRVQSDTLLSATQYRLWHTRVIPTPARLHVTVLTVIRHSCVA